MCVLKTFTAFVFLGTISALSFGRDSYKQQQWDWETLTKDFENIPLVQCPDRALSRCDCKVDVKKSMYLVSCGAAIQSSDIHLVPHNTTHLALFQNELKTLPHGSFDKTTHLLCLDLSYNLLSTIERHTFAGLTNLFFLDLSNNLLHGPAVFLQFLSSLRALILTNQDHGYLDYPIKYIVGWNL